jgi:hypothetical protein
MAKGSRGICAPPSSLVPCVGARRRVPLAGGDRDEKEKAERNKALGLTPGPSKCGILNKRGETIFKGWAERVVVLDDMVLRYYDMSFKDTEKPPLKSARGQIPLNSKSQVKKLDGEHAPRSRGAGLDWKGSVTDGKGMPFCFQVETAGKEYVFQAASDSERSGWIQALHVCIESLARLEPRAQHQNELVNEKRSFASTIMGALTPLSGRSTPATEDDDDEITDMMITDGLSQQLRLALKGQEREEERVRRAEILKKAAEEAEERGEVYVAPSEEQGPDREKKKHGKPEKQPLPPKPPKGGSEVPSISGGWCSAPDLGVVTPSWLGFCDGKARHPGPAESEDPLLPPVSVGKAQNKVQFEGQVKGNGGRIYQPSSSRKKHKGKLTKHAEVGEAGQAGEASEGEDQGDAAPTTPGGRPYVAPPAFSKKGKQEGRSRAGGEAAQPCAAVASHKAHGTDTGGIGGTEMEALFDFVPEQPDELPLTIGDRVVVYKEFEDGWCSARILAPATRRGGRDRVTLIAEGIVPRSYLRPAPPRHTAAHAQSDADAESLAACERGALDAHGKAVLALQSKGGQTKGGLPSALKGSRQQRQRDSILPNDEAQILKITLYGKVYIGIVPGP